MEGSCRHRARLAEGKRSLMPGGVSSDRTELSMDLALADKRALVTGASRGIGLAVARCLVAEGATVVSGSRANSPELEALGDVGNVVQIAVDLLTESGPSDLVEAATNDGQIDILVNNAGAVTPRLEGF